MSLGFTYYKSVDAKLFAEFSWLDRATISTLTDYGTTVPALIVAGDEAWGDWALRALKIYDENWSLGSCLVVNYEGSDLVATRQGTATAYPGTLRDDYIKASTSLCKSIRKRYRRIVWMMGFSTIRI